MRVYIWGTGWLASDYLKRDELTQEEVIGFIETKKSKSSFWGKCIYEPHEIAQRNDYDYILVCVYYYGREILNICENAGIDITKLVLADNWEWIDSGNMRKPLRTCCKKISESGIDVQSLFPKLYNQYIKERDIQAKRYIVISRNGYDLVENDALILQAEFSGKEYQTDYFRYRTFELMANEIVKSNVAGNAAEVGVFMGTFAKMINAKFPDKKLYLFDTFESFDLDEFHDELTQGRCPDNFLDGFKNTSVNEVMAIMKYPDNCIVRKGLFPNTASGLEDERYAFVSIDVDFEKSILECLRYFYPRLNRGGVIFIHDYNNRFLEGVKKAVEVFEQETGSTLPKVPLADEGGTLVVMKA